MTDTQEGREARQAGPAIEHQREAAPRTALLDHYQLEAIQRLRDRGTLNAMMVAILEGSREGTVEEFGVLARAAEMCGREAGAALVCLGEVGSSEGTA